MSNPPTDLNPPTTTEPQRSPYKPYPTIYDDPFTSSPPIVVNDFFTELQLNMATRRATKQPSARVEPYTKPTPARKAAAAKLSQNEETPKAKSPSEELVDKKA